MIKNKISWNPLLIITGAVMGVSFSLLVKLGNPPNMGICVVCFIRDVAGGIALHSLKNLSYIRPEFVGFIIGAATSALFFREFRPQGASQPVIRFLIGIIIGFNALIFLGCPIRMFGRLGGGDWTALGGLAGIAVSVIIFNILVNSGFRMEKSKEIKPAAGWIMPVLGAILLVLCLANFRNLGAEHKGHAPLLASLLFGLILGILGQRSRFCSIGGTTDLIAIRNFNQVQGTAAFLVFLIIMNLVLNQFNPGKHPVAHTLHLWNFLSMLVVGIGSLVIGGCPFKQTIMASQGNLDASLSVIGMFIGVSFGHALGFLASPADVPFGGRITVLASILILALFTLSKTVSGRLASR